LRKRPSRRGFGGIEWTHHATARRACGEYHNREEPLVDSIDELDMYEAEKRLKLYNEYQDAIRVFQFYVETELRAYLSNGVDVEPVSAPGGTFFKVTLTDAWIYEAERPQRFVPEVVIYEVGPVHVQKLRGDDE
jgi:hypothetical protein